MLSNYHQYSIYIVISSLFNTLKNITTSLPLPPLSSPSVPFACTPLFTTMVKSNTTMMTVCILVALMLAGLPRLEAQSPLGAPVKSPRARAPTTTTTAAPAPAPAVDCFTALANVSDCLGYVQTGSNLTVPDKNCCPEFAGLLESNPICLCTLIGQAESFNVDLNRALMLPSVCKLEVPSIDACPASPSLAPTPSSPGEAPASTAAGPGPSGGGALSPSGTGSGGINGASGTAVHDLSTIVRLAVAMFIAYYF